ncbi:hypothetical protein JCM5350_006715 [Sporobolomyces pararoseus]
MLNQTDMVRYLSTEPPPPQHIVFSLLHAYVFSKSRRGNLPSETLSKLLSIQRKLLIQRGSKPFPPESPIARAFEAMRIQMLVVNKKWMVEGVSAFGPLGAIGSTGNSPIAIEAWRKATDNKIKTFPTSLPNDEQPSSSLLPLGPELDAGRVIGPGFTDSADPRTSRDGFPLVVQREEEVLEGFDGLLPPGYDGPPSSDNNDNNDNINSTRGQDRELVEAMQDRLNGETGRPSSLTISETGRTTRNENREGEGEGEGSVSPPPPRTTTLNGGKDSSSSIEAGVSELARLRALKEERERLEEENNRRMLQDSNSTTAAAQVARG